MIVATDATRHVDSNLPISQRMRYSLLSLSPAARNLRHSIEEFKGFSHTGGDSVANG